MNRFGLSIDLLSSDTWEHDELSKAFTSGPKASHKYWRRVRVMHRGHLTWRYYYNTPEDRKRFLEDRKKKHHRGKHEDLGHLGDSEIEALHISRYEWNDHFAESRDERTPLAELNPTRIFARAGLTPPTVTLDDKASDMARQYTEGDDEPDDLWCKAIHPLRALETAVELLPPEISATMPDALKDVKFFGTKKAASDWTKAQGWKRPPSNAAAWALGRVGAICIPLETTSLMESRPWAKANATIGGGNYPVAILLHEMAHCFEAKLRDPEWRKKNKSAPNWADWESIKKFKGRGKEPGITAYAEKNLSERFCESFAAALLTPVLLAEQCPEAYNFMHRMMPSKVPPREEALAFAMRNEDLVTFSDPWHLPPKGGKGPVAQEIQENSSPNQVRASINDYRVNPSDPDKIGRQDGGRADRFFEMSHRGRKVFFRYGMSNDTDLKDGKPNTVWDPAGPGKPPPHGQKMPKISQIKEVFDEKGNAVLPELAYLHLIQDDLDDDTVIGVDGKTKITMRYVREHGGVFGGDPKIKKIFDRSEGRAMFHRILRGFSKSGLTTKLNALAAAEKQLDKLSPTAPERTKLQAKRDALHADLITDADASSLKARRSG